LDSDLKALADLIAERETERLKQAANAQLIEQYRQDQETARAKALKEQEKATVEAKTQLEVAEIEATQRKEVEKAKLEKDLEAAGRLRDAAKKEAEATVTLAEADADNTNKQNAAEVAGLKAAVSGFASPEQYAQYQVLLRVAPALKEVFSSDTSDFAKLFSGYLAAPAAKSAAPPVRTQAPPPMPPAVGPGGQ
jgi:hypothetical protein